MENYLAPLDLTFHALSDPTRRAVLNRLMQGPAPVKELAAPFEMGLPSFMKHLRVLEDSGLIRSEKAGRVRTCRIEAKQLAAAESWLSEQRTLWEAQTDRLADYVENQMP
jgi:DNA-binding transcriptional ArsR family regulator